MRVLAEGDSNGVWVADLFVCSKRHFVGLFLSKSSQSSMHALHSDRRELRKDKISVLCSLLDDSQSFLCLLKSSSRTLIHSCKTLIHSLRVLFSSLNVEMVSFKGSTLVLIIWVITCICSWVNGGGLDILFEDLRDNHCDGYRYDAVVKWFKWGNSFTFMVGYIVIMVKSRLIYLCQSE